MPDRFYVEQGVAGLHPSMLFHWNARPYVVAAIEHGTNRVLYSELIPVDAGAVARGENLSRWVEVLDLVERVRVAAELKLETEAGLS
jgi:hypothetical protein